MPNLKNKTKFNGSSIPKNVGWLEKYGDGGKKGKKQGNPVSDWFYNTEDVQGTYKMAPDLDPFLKNWLKNPETQKRLKNNLASSFLTKDEDPKKLTDQAISRLDNLPMFSRELVQKSGISSSDIKNNNELQGWKTPSSIGNNPYYKGNKDQLGVYMPDYHVSMVNNFNSPGVITHEQTHGTGPFQKNMEKVIFEKYFDKKNNPDKKFIGDWSSARDEHLHRINEPIEKLKQRYPAIYDDYKKNQEYLDKDGMYPRIMDIRRSLNLKPGQKVDKSIFENNSILGPVDDLKTYYDDDTIIDMLNTLAKSNNVKNLPTAKYGGWLDTYGNGGETLEQKINKALGDPRKKAADAAINKKWFNKETKKWEIEDDTDNFRHPMAARYTAEAIANKFPDWMKYSGIPQVAGFVGSTALGVGHELANNKYTSNDPKDYPNYTFWDTVSEAGEDAFNNIVGAGVGVLPISDDKKTSFLKYLSDNNMLPDGLANKKEYGGWLEKYGDGGLKSVTGPAPKFDAKTEVESKRIASGYNNANKQNAQISQTRNWSQADQEHSDRVKARINNPASDVGILAANMASNLTRFRNLTPEEIARVTDNIGETVNLSSGIATDALTNELVGYGATKAIPFVSKSAKAAGKYLTEETALKNAYKVNPFAFKPNPEAYYRMVGKEGIKDATESGVIRANQKIPLADNGEPFGGMTTPEFDVPYFSKSRPFDGRNYNKTPYYGSYEGPGMIEVKNTGNFKSLSPRADYIGLPKSTIKTSDDVVKLYQQDWLQGYKEVPKELSGSSNASSLLERINLERQGVKTKSNVIKENIQDGNFKITSRSTPNKGLVNVNIESPTGSIQATRNPDGSYGLSFEDANPFNAGKSMLKLKDQLAGKTIHETKSFSTDSYANILKLKKKLPFEEAGFLPLNSSNKINNFLDDLVIKNNNEWSASSKFKSEESAIEGAKRIDDYMLKLIANG